MIFWQLKRYVQSAGILVALILVLSSCATTDKDAPIEVDPYTADVIKSSKAPYSQALAETADRVKTGAEDEDRVKVFKGSGIMVKGQLPGGAVPPATVSPSAKGGGNVVLNFEAADLREVIRNILGDILGEAYLIDPTVNGQVTIRTTAGIPREALYATLETLLRMNNATMVKEEGVYKILPAAVGVKGSVTPQLGSSQRPLPKGYSVQVVPLRYVGAKEMMKILEPFAKDAQALRADELRNLMILSGTELELRHLLETIEMFDIDWMAGMSIGIFKLKNVEVKGLAQDIQTALGNDNMGLISGVLKFIPIERMNALMVVSPQPGYLDEAKKWIEKFDEDGSGETPRLYVYALKYARADRLAPLLQQAFTGKSTAPTRVSQPTLAPGASGVMMGGGLPGLSSNASRTTSGARQTTPTTTRSPMTGATAAGTAAAGTTIAGRTTTTRPGVVPAVGTTAGGGMGIAQDIQVVADEDNNAILIVATPAEYALAEQAIKKLDVPQRQVVIEVTMAEVNLDDQGEVGSKWWFSSGDIYGGLGAVSPLSGATTDGNIFNLIVKPGASIAAIIRASGKGQNVKVVANPHIAALDNQEATINVTTPTPVLTTNATDTQVAQNYTYIEPGIKVTIKPHINEGGNVSLETDIEFSAISGTPPEGGAAPPLLKRSVSSQLMVPSGGTMVIGGLIRDDKNFGNEGVPFLSQIPVLGALLGTQNWKNTRTELVIFLTPRVVENDETRRAIIQDLRYRMDNLEGLLQESKALPTDLLKREDILSKPKEAGEGEEDGVDSRAESPKGVLFQTQPQVAPAAAVAPTPSTAPRAATPPSQPAVKPISPPTAQPSPAPTTVAPQPTVVRPPPQQVVPAAQPQPANPPAQTPKATPAAATSPAQPATRSPLSTQTPQGTPVAPAPAGVPARPESGTVISPQSLRSDEGASVVVASPLEQPTLASPRVVVPASGSAQNDSQGRAIVIPQQNANPGGAGAVVRVQ